MVYMESNDYKSWKMRLTRDEEMTNEVYTNKTEAIPEQLTDEYSEIRWIVCVLLRSTFWF